MIATVAGDGFSAAAGTSTDRFTDEEAARLVQEGKAVPYANEKLTVVETASGNGDNVAVETVSNRRRGKRSSARSQQSE